MKAKDLSPVKQVRRVPAEIKLSLFVYAGGRCEFNGCNHYLLEHSLTLTKGNFAEVAHIVAFKEGGPRGKVAFRPTRIHDSHNLMLLCHECHKLIDDNPDVFTVPILKEYKQNHEKRIKHLTGLGPDLKTTVVQLKAKIGSQAVAIPANQIVEAVSPRYPIDLHGWVIDLTALDDSNPLFIDLAAKEIERQVSRIYAPGMDVESTRHISLFALAPIPLLVYLGSQLSNKIPVDLFQRHRDIENWVWKDEAANAHYKFEVIRVGTNKSKVGLVLSLSGKITNTELPDEIDESFFLYEIILDGETPNPNFLRTKQDLDNFKREYHLALRRIYQSHGPLSALHLFPAIPAPIAILCGREVLPKIDPALYVYDNNKAKGGFALALRINDYE